MEYDWFSGDDYDFGGDDSSMFDWDSWLEGGDLEADYEYGFDYGDDWNVSDVDANSPWTGYESGGDYGDGSSSQVGAGSASSGSWSGWGSLINAGLGAAQGYAEYEGKRKMSKEDWKARLEYQKAIMAEQEKYRQMHGKELSDAYGKYVGLQPTQGQGILSGVSGSPFQGPQAGPIFQNQGMNYGY